MKFKWSIVTSLDVFFSVYLSNKQINEPALLNSKFRFMMNEQSKIFISEFLNRFLTKAWRYEYKTREL